MNGANDHARGRHDHFVKVSFPPTPVSRWIRKDFDESVEKKPAVKRKLITVLTNNRLWIDIYWYVCSEFEYQHDFDLSCFKIPPTLRKESDHYVGRFSMIRPIDTLFRLNVYSCSYHFHTFHEKDKNKHTNDDKIHRETQIRVTVPDKCFIIFSCMLVHTGSSSWITRGYSFPFS